MRISSSSLLLTLILLGAGCVGASNSSTVALTLPSGDVVHVPVARTETEQNAGLSGKSDIGDGLLFCMQETRTHEFWMLAMNMPIDMVWIHGGEVRGVAARVPVREQNDWTRRSSNEPVNMILELPAGNAQAFGLEVGILVEGAVEACGQQTP